MSQSESLKPHSLEIQLHHTPFFLDQLTIFAMSLTDLTIKNAAEPWDKTEAKQNTPTTISERIAEKKTTENSECYSESELTLLPPTSEISPVFDNRLAKGSSILSFLFHDDLKEESLQSSSSMSTTATLQEEPKLNARDLEIESVSSSLSININEADDDRSEDAKFEPQEHLDVETASVNGASVPRIIVHEISDENNDENGYLLHQQNSDEQHQLEHEPQQILTLHSQPQQKLCKPSNATKPNRRKNGKEFGKETSGFSGSRSGSGRTSPTTTANLKSGLEHDLGYHALFDTGKRYPSTSCIQSHSPNKMVQVYRVEAVGRRFTKIDEINKHHIFNDEIAYRKLSTTSRVLIVDEDTRVEDALQVHVHAMEKRLNRNNYSALEILDAETQDPTPVGYEYSDRVLRRRHQIAWAVGLSTPMSKKGVVETTIPVAATHYYTRRISFWRRLCSRLKICFTCWRSANSDLEVDSGLLTAESIEAFQQELNIMEYLGAQHKRTLERRQDIVETTNSMKKLMSSIATAPPNHQKRKSS